MKAPILVIALISIIMLTTAGCDFEQPDEEAQIYKGPPREDAIEYYRGVCISLQGSENHFNEIQQAKKSGANIITIMVDYGLDENGRPTVHELYGLDTRERKGYENWRYNLKEIINTAHQNGLRVEIKNAETGNDVEDFIYQGTPEDYIAGYLDITRELAQIAETYNVYQFCIWTEADHMIMQGNYGIIDAAYIDTGFEGVLNDWSNRMLMTVREHFHGKVGIGFSGLPASFEYLNSSLDIHGVDYIEFSFYGDVYDDYTINTGINALEAISHYRNLITNNGIEIAIIGETALEESIADLSSLQRQEIYNEFFQITHNLVNGYFLMMFPPNADPDLQLVAEEWYLKLD